MMQNMILIRIENYKNYIKNENKYFIFMKYIKLYLTIKRRFFYHNQFYIIFYAIILYNIKNAL